MTELNETCPIWGTPAKVDHKHPDTGQPFDGKFVYSPRAGGYYLISGTAIEILKNIPEESKPDIQMGLTRYIVQQNMLGGRPEISSAMIEKRNYPLPLTVEKKMTNFLNFINKKEEYTGQEIRIFPDVRIEYLENNNMKIETLSPPTGNFLLILAYIDAKDIREIRKMINFCKELNYIGEAKNGEIYLKPQGYKQIQKSQKQKISDQAFVAMWFDKSMDKIYHEAIEPAIIKAGYIPLRIDKKEHNNRIDDEIIAEIRRSKFLVADFTHGDEGARGGVYYEAGFAHGLGIPVIFTCKERINLHFDTRQYNHIFWNEESLEEFKRNLSIRISATIGDGPHKKK